MPYNAIYKRVEENYVQIIAYTLQALRCRVAHASLDQVERQYQSGTVYVLMINTNNNTFCEVHRRMARWIMRTFKLRTENYAGSSRVFLLSRQDCYSQLWSH